MTIVMTICSTVCVLTTGAQTDRAYIRQGNRTMRAGAEGGAVDSEAETSFAYSADATASVLGTEIGEAFPVLQESCSAEGTLFTGEGGAAEESMALRVQPRGDKWEPPMVSWNLLQIDWVYGMGTKTSQVLGKILEVE